MTQKEKDLLLKKIDREVLKVGESDALYKQMKQCIDSFGNGPSDCVYADIAFWDQDHETGKATPEYYCERRKVMCDESTCSECKSFDDGKDD